ncbi:hypothetical protein SCHPADRAFT_693195 [Schizopora paradoxa]|uniref:F-box domain-containing protein n=1 Tax=Schizopora paradoxa TaxID=27342 RepID=A0A0H2RNA6_9AGAM|nr:hypothetical protein SCHPADRAFT_693195 [Schizopora paradoxa]
MQYISHILQNVSNSASEVLDLYSNRLEHFSSKLSRGFSSLPNELVSHILSLASHSSPDTALSATKLSHVSQQFRRLILGDQSLWTTLSLWHGGASKESLKRQISLSGSTSDLQVIILYGGKISPSVIHSFVATCSPSASRWQSLTFHGVWEEKHFISISDELLQLMKQHHLVLPRLHELCLSDFDLYYSKRVVPRWVSSSTDFGGILPWVAPNLRTLICEQFIPSPSFPFSFSVFKLNLMLNPHDTHDQINDLFQFLGSRQNIPEFILNLTGLEFNIGGEQEIITSTFPALTSFHYKISPVVIETVQCIYGPILEALQMPDLHCFFLSTEVLTSNGSHSDPDAQGFDSLFEKLLPDPDVHPLLTTVTVTILRHYSYRIVGAPEDEAPVIPIPLAKLPHVSSLRITTFGRVSFYRPPETNPSSLRELQIVGCSRLDIEGLQLAVQSLKDGGAWEELERVIVENCDLLDLDSALEVVGEKRLRFVQ